LQVKCKKNAILAIALVTAVFTATIAAQTFYLIWIQTPFVPTNYSWEEPWEIKEMVDFIEATLTVEGCGYEGQSHDAELVIKNVATTPDQYATAFDYLCKWFVDETHQETLFVGAYSGEPMSPGENVTYTMVWTPTVIGAGVMKMNVIDIAWLIPEAITWQYDVVDDTGGKISVTNFEVTGASVNVIEDGTVTFTIKNTQSSAITIGYTVKIVELAQTIGELLAPGELLAGGASQIYNHDFGALANPGTYTMELTVRLH